MGYYKTKEAVVRAAIQEIASVASPSSAVNVSPAEEHLFNKLGIITSEAMEKTIYPFALIYSRLENTVVDQELDPENLNSIFAIPQTASEIGVFVGNSLPDVGNIVVDTDSVKQYSIDYYHFNDKLVVQGKPPEGESFYLVYTTPDPEVALMYSTFQRYLVFQMAAEHYFKIGSNSRLASYLYKLAADKRSAAEKLVIDKAANSVRNFRTVSNVLALGRPDGSV